MFSATAHTVRRATEADAADMALVAILDGHEHPVAMPALIGEVDGVPVAAISPVDGRVTADPWRRTQQIVSHMRMRAAGERAHVAVPSLRERIRAAIRMPHSRLADPRPLS